ncbi:10583_t:CDS:1, partial [Acaulospora colombiana]
SRFLLEHEQRRLVHELVKLSNRPAGDIACSGDGPTCPLNLQIDYALLLSMGEAGAEVEAGRAICHHDTTLLT